MTRLRTQANQVAKQYVSESHRPGNWAVMEKRAGGHYIGDCEDFVVTVLYLYLGSIFKLCWKVLTGSVKFYRCQSLKVGNVPHLVGDYNGLKFDCIYPKPSPTKVFKRTMPHKGAKRVGRLECLYRIVLGVFEHHRRNPKG